VFSAQIFQENTFLKTKPNFHLTGKCFLLTNFPNDKQTQESLESDFPETTFRKTDTAKKENTFLKTKPNFLLTRKCFSLTNFSNCKQTRESFGKWFPGNCFPGNKHGLSSHSLNFLFHPYSFYRSFFLILSFNYNFLYVLFFISFLILLIFNFVFIPF